MGNAVNVMLWGLSWDHDADKTDKIWDMHLQAFTSMAAGAIKAIALRDRPDVIAIYGEYTFATLKSSLLGDQPTALNRCDDLNSIRRVAHRHGCMPHTC